MTAALVTASTLWANLETLLARRMPRIWAQSLLGVWGGVGRYPRRLEEFAWPGRAATSALARRAGLEIVVGGGTADDGLAAHLSAGREAIVAVDAYELPYRPAFRRVHAARTILVRAGVSPAEVHVEDSWPPAWSGSIAAADLARARLSSNPVEPVREPLFSGTPVAGRWWAVIGGDPPPDPDVWLRARLQDLHADLPSEIAFVAPAALGERLSAGPAPGSLCRRLSLILRAEVSARLYRGRLLALAAHRLQDDWLHFEADRQWDVLQQLALARDLLAKAVVLPRPEYFRIAGSALVQAAAAERTLKEALVAYAPAGQAARRRETAYA